MKKVRPRVHVHNFRRRLVLGIFIGAVFGFPLGLGINDFGLGSLIGAAFGAGISATHTRRQELLAHKKAERERLLTILLIFLICIALLIFAVGVYFAWCDCFYR